MFYWFAYCIQFVLSFLFFPLVVKGGENIPKKKSCIFASNHVSNLDPIIVGLAVRRHLSYMAKQSLFKSAVARFFLPKVGAFPVNRGAKDIRAIKEALKRLKNKDGLLIFPEGTRGSEKQQKNVYPGIGFLAVKSGVCVVPVYIDGSRKVMPPGCMLPKRGFITVNFGRERTYFKGQDYTEVALSIKKDIDSLSPRG